VPHSIETDKAVDSGLACLVLLARFHGLPADPDHLSHQRGADQPFSATDIVLSARSLGLKARSLKSNWGRLAKTPLPAIARHSDGHYFVLASLRARRQAIVRVVVWLGKGAPFPAPHA
jgi:subfamily B ATP-binding cassette protein HlyB/CyaB